MTGQTWQSAKRQQGRVFRDSTATNGFTKPVHLAHGFGEGATLPRMRTMRLLPSWALHSSKIQLYVLIHLLLTLN